MHRFITIATRVFKLGNKKIVAKLGKPYKVDDSYCCPYIIGDEQIKEIYGVDSLQSVQLAIKLMGVELDLMNRDCNFKMMWLDEKGDLGFEGSECIPELK